MVNMRINYHLNLLNINISRNQQKILQKIRNNLQINCEFIIVSCPHTRWYPLVCVLSIPFWPIMRRRKKENQAIAQPERIPKEGKGGRMCEKDNSIENMKHTVSPSPFHRRKGESFTTTFTSSCLGTAPFCIPPWKI